jgi:hypothetical protein
MELFAWAGTAVTLDGQCIVSAEHPVNVTLPGEREDA